MKNKNVSGVIALVIVTALSFGVIAGSNALSQDMTAGTAAAQTSVLEELDVSGAENIERAVKTEDGYLVTVREKGYAGDIVMEVAFDQSAATITSVQVTQQNETESLGAKIAEPEFLDQFQGVAAPVYLPGMSLDETAADDEAAAQQEALDALEGAALADGTYTATTGEYDGSGFMDEVSITVENGAITAVSWDALMEDGSQKSVMSENGEYTMTEDGPTWKEQSEALAAALIEHQSLSFLTTNEEGKTDAVSGVSVSVGGFISLAQQCLEQAAGISADPLEGAELADGTYTATTGEYDGSGFMDEVSITVENGAITAVSWDALMEDGSQKSVMSENGEYTMTEDGPTWKEQSEALAAALIEHQSLSFLTTNEEGKTDAVSGVSVSVGGFISLAQQCLEQAAGVEPAETETPAAPQNGTQVDAVSGATRSSTAAVTGINDAYNFLQTVK
ncbi:MAG: FMN-binding protein [Eubacteriales bacterium]|nr:FMN-binding protein [Eubacteriales bacterium]